MSAHWKQFSDGEKVPTANINYWLDIREYSSDPDTSGWGASEKGRMWFNTTENVYKYWNGSAIQYVGDPNVTIVGATIQVPVDIQDATDTGREALCTAYSSIVTALESAVRTTNTNSDDINTGLYKTAQVFINVTAVGGDADETLDVYVDVKDPIGGTWNEIFHFTQILQTGGATQNFQEQIGEGCETNKGIGNTIRIRTVVGGTTPSFTFSVGIVLKS